MSPKSYEKKFPTSYANTLIRIAKGDLETAKVLLDHDDDFNRRENTAYMIQQCMEKSLKAILVALNLNVPLVHDLGALIAKLPDSLNPDFGYELSEFTVFATIRRYEEGGLLLDKDELVSMYQLGLKVYTWCEEIIKNSKAN